MAIFDEYVPILNAAFSKVRLLETIWGDDIPWNAITSGFELNGEQLLLANKARGIFKPRHMKRGLISIKTTQPRSGRVNPYDDKETAEGYFEYALQAGDPKENGNKHLWEALEDKSPFIYFHAVAEGIYKAIWPCFVAAIHVEKGFCEVVVGTPRLYSLEKPNIVEYEIPPAPARAYAVRETRVRLFQATFRENVLRAYGRKCAISGLPVPQLLDAAHITPDSEADSSTEVTNGIALSKLHHRAFDSNLIGITPDLQIVIGNRLMEISDVLFVEAIKETHGKRLILPRHIKSHPEKARLEQRFDLYKKFNE